MWIMITKKLPTQYSPPMLSIFWSTLWTDGLNGYVITQQRRRLAYVLGDSVGDEVDRCMKQDTIPGMFGFREPNWELARKIHYRGCDIRVFPHEFVEVSRENMRHYVHGMGGGSSHVLVTDNTPGEQLLFDGVLDKDQRPLYDAALVEGATHEQAISLAIGVDVTYPDYEFPPIGWYKIKPEYGLVFCEEYELEEQCMNL